MDYISLVRYLRESCLVDEPVTGEDSEFIALTDEQLEGILFVASHKAKIDLNSLDEGDIYLLMLVAKKEVYYRLAVKSAPLYNIEGSSGKLERSSRFTHYNELIQRVEEEYRAYIEELETNRDVSNNSSYNSAYTEGQVFLNSRYFTSRNYKHATTPKVKLKVDNIYKDKLEVSWKLKQVNRFAKFELYISEIEPIIDEYNNKSISPKAIKVAIVNDIHINKYRILNLAPSTTYHIAIVVREENGLIGYDELQSVTLEEVI